MNAALGFDTFLVMRHGVPTKEADSTAQPVIGQPYTGQLGCYFCNDIMAARDVRNRFVSRTPSANLCCSRYRIAH